ncbi:Paraflagellar rod protein 2 [Trypanosoma cruzi]|uniref:Paraflagellar rod protein 2 n=1 Tax=Trypanosoma cruzi TaxID=5693 RepID=A0A2V2XIE3_TRYCR|nr:Paraflagellar rod protein 2 [Trypanosoma cruzi]
MSYKEASGAVGPADQQQPAVPEVTDVTLEAARKQKIHNLKLKTSCLSNEEFIQDLHVSDWSETQKQKLLAAHEKAQELLASVEGGTKWNLTEAYDIKKLMRVCGLQLSVRELYKPEDKPHFMEVVALKKTLNELKQHHNKTRTVSFTGTIDNAIAKLEKIEDELRRSQLDASEMAQVPVAVLKNLEECMNVTVVQTALLGNEEQIKAQLAAIEKAKEIRNVAIADGEMAIAEEQYYIKAQLLEHLVELVADKFRIIGQTEDENKPFGRIQDVQKKSFQETSAIKDAKRRLKQRCEDDLKNLHDAIQKADMEDAEAMKRFATQKEKSEKFIQENLDRQDEAWRRIQELERVLQRLGTERFEEVKRRIEENDREEKRKVEYQQFLDVCGQHKKLLELSVYNCDLAMRCIGMMEELVAEGCSAIKSRHDKTNEELADLRLQVHQEYLEAFRRLYKTLGQLVYKKEKRLEEIDRNIRTTHIQLEFAIETFDPNAKKHSDAKKELYKLRAQVEEELEMLKDKMAQALEMFGPTEDALNQAGIEFVHPAEEVEDGNLIRRSKMVEYRAHLAKQEEVKIAAEREELKRSKTLQSQQYRGKTVQQITQ